MALDHTTHHKYFPSYYAHPHHVEKATLVTPLLMRSVYTHGPTCRGHDGWSTYGKRHACMRA